ncbi:hypothetical protein [Streptomyces sp. NPDC046805]|uniref:hypothetical protein n=1 Tax=Streptomyces sp. NPDC046805 TaxID=3155134 RepID=UPI0033F54EAF
MPTYPPRAAVEGQTPPGPGRDHEPGTPLRARWRRQSARVRAVTVAATVVALALGGTVAYAATSRPSGGGTVTAPSAASSASPSPGGPGSHHDHFGWFGPGGIGVHGETTVKDRDTGKWVVRIWQRGTVENVDHDHVTLKSEDGARWAWTVGSDTPVGGFDRMPQSGAGALKKGDKAFLIGTRSDDGTRTAAFALVGDFDHRRERRDDGRDRAPDHDPWGHRTALGS